MEQHLNYGFQIIAYILVMLYLEQEKRVAAAMPEGHCGGFGTSPRMRCGTLKRLGTRQRRPDDPGHRQLGSHSKSTTAIFSAPIGRLGCRRGSPRAPGERRPPAGTPIKPSSRGRAAGNYRSPTSTQDCRTSLHGFPLMGRDARRAAGRKGPLPETRAGALRRVLTPPSPPRPHRPSGPALRRDAS